MGKIRSGIQNVTEASMKLGEAIYKAQQAEGQAEDEPRPVDEDIVDAEYEDVDQKRNRS